MFRWHDPKCNGLTMDEETFINRVGDLFALVAELRQVGDDNPDFLGLLSFQDYLLLSNIVKEYTWDRC